MTQAADQVLTLAAGHVLAPAADQILTQAAGHV
jgi:hypothetical protein